VDGKTALIVLGLVVLAVVVGLLVRGTETQRLRRAWFRDAPVPRLQAEELLMRHMVALQEKFPGRTEAWYLKKILAELRRDRR
jgi:hypothetical protein